MRMQCQFKNGGNSNRVIFFKFMNNHKIFKCPNCAKKKISCNLIKKQKSLICKNCKTFYPYYKGVPVLLKIEDDFYHLKKALSPAEYRVHKYEN